MHTHTHTHTYTPHTQTKTQNHKKLSKEEQARENALDKVCRVCRVCRGCGVCKVLRRHVTLQLAAAAVRAWRNRLEQR